MYYKQTLIINKCIFISWHRLIYSWWLYLLWQNHSPSCTSSYGGVINLYPLLVSHITEEEINNRYRETYLLLRSTETRGEMTTVRQTLTQITHTHTHTHTERETETERHTHTLTHSHLFLWIVGTLHRRKCFYTVQTVFSITLHQPYT